MEENRTQWLIALGLLVALCTVSLVCVVGLGGYTFLTYSEVAEGPFDQGGAGDGSGQQPANTLQEPPQIRKGSNELVLLGADPATLDPALTGDVTSAGYIVELFSGLVSLNLDLEVVPDIASSWEISEDGTLYTFTLREDVTFADGKPVTAADFKYSIERACDPATQSPVADTYLGDIVGCRDKLRGQADEVAGVRVLEDHRLEIQIDAPKVYFLSKLTYPTAFVVDQETIEQEGQLWASKRPNGTGAFRLQSYSFGERLVLVPNEHYYGDPKPSVSQVTYILSGGSSMTMYETDEIDVVGVGPADLDRVLDAASPLNDEVQEVESLSVSYIALNADHKPFDDPLVRQAFNLAIDKERLVEVVIRNLVEPAYGVLPPGIPGYNPDLQGLRFDPERARELLGESSYGGPEGLPDITLHVSGVGGTAPQEMEAIVEMWKQNLGVEVAIEQTEEASFLFDVTRRPNPYQSFAIGWVADYPDPQNFLDLLFHCESLENKSGYCNPQVDELLEEARVEQDSARRIELYQQAEQIIVEDAAWVPLWFSRGYVLVKPWVKDFFFPPTVVPTLKYVKIEH